MNKRGSEFISIITAVVFGIILISLTSFASADIFLSKQPEDIYNLGDTMNVVLGSDGSGGWANIDLVCSNQTKMIYFRYLTDETAIDIFAPFNKEFLRGMIGNCFLALNFNGKPKQSFAFIISDILADNGARTAAFGSNSILNVPGKTVAVKTGTTDRKKDNLAVGYTPSVVVGVWVGNNDNSDMSPVVASGITGASPIWNKIIRIF